MSFIHELVIVFRFNVSFIDKRHLMTEFYGCIIFFLNLHGYQTARWSGSPSVFHDTEMRAPRKRHPSSTILYKKWKHQVAENPLKNTLSIIKQLPNSWYISKFFTYVLHGFCCSGEGVWVRWLKGCLGGRNKVISCPLEF